MGTPLKFTIYDLVNGGELELQLNPESIKDQKGVNWARVPIQGMSHPRYQFMNGEPRIIRFTVFLYWDNDPYRVLKDSNWLKSLEYPTHDGTMLKRTPAVCLLIFGTWFNPRVVFTNIDVNYTMFRPEDMLPIRAEIECVAEELVEASVGPMEVRG